VEAATREHQVRDGDWRRIYVLQHPILISIAVTMLLTGVLLSTSPPLFQHSVVARALPQGLEYPWDACLVLGSALILVGIWRLDSRFEASGAVLLAAALTIWVFVYVTETDHNGEVSVILAPALAGAVACGMALRAFTLVTAPEARPWLKRSRS
jgi:hypothetical protein